MPIHARDVAMSGTDPAIRPTDLDEVRPPQRRLNRLGYVTKPTLSLQIRPPRRSHAAEPVENRLTPWYAR